MAGYVGDQREGGLRYTHRGKRYVSVTTVLDMEPKPWMRAWATRETALWAVESRPTWQDLEPDDAVALIKRGPEKHKTRAANLGTAVHLYAEWWGKRQEAMAAGAGLDGLEREPQVPGEVAPYCRSFVRFLDDHRPVPVLTEEKVFNTKVRYAGTFDSILRFPDIWPGENVLLDYKSGKGTYGTVAMQLRALAEAEFMQGPDGEELDFPRPTRYMVVHLRPTKYALKVVDAGRDEVWRSFRALRAVYDWTTKVCDQVITEYGDGD